MKLLIILVLSPLSALTQISEITGYWCTENEQFDLDQKSTITLVKDRVVKQIGSYKSDFIEEYNFQLDGTFTQGMDGLLTSSSGSGNWTLTDTNQLVLKYSVGDKTMKRTFNIVIINSNKLRLREI